LQLILSPENGWEEISHDGESIERLTAEGLYPLFGLAAITVFIQGLYVRTFQLVPTLQKAMAVFIVLFIAFFIGKALMEAYLARFTDGEPGNRQAATFTVYIMALLAMIQILTNCVPVEVPLLLFLPAFVAPVIWKAKNWLDILPRLEGSFMMFAIGVLLMPTICLNCLMNLLFF
jgi:hypothetical protein